MKRKKRTKADRFRGTTGGGVSPEGLVDRKERRFGGCGREKSCPHGKTEKPRKVEDFTEPRNLRKAIRYCHGHNIRSSGGAREMPPWSTFKTEEEM